MASGFRITAERRLPPRHLLAAFAGLQVAIVSDNMSRGAGDGGLLRPFSRRRRLCGPALTVRTRRADNLMIHKAIEMAAPGDVLVVAAGGDTAHAVFGEIMLELCVARGVAGVVIDGAIRDSDAIAGRDEFAVFARGASHRGPYKDGPGTINEPVPIGDLVVSPGDIVLADGDGVVAVPLDDAAAVLAAAQAQEAREAAQLAAIRDGTVDRRWIDETLRAKGAIG